MLTAEGEGPLLAYNNLSMYEPKIVAVTFPLSFSAKRPDKTQFRPQIPERLLKFFSGVEISIIVPDTLPFDDIEEMDGHNQQMRLVRKALAMFGGGFGVCVQAVLRACDAGVVEPGERVIAIGGDCAALITASTTAKFLSKEGISINEIFCKPKNLTIARPLPAPKGEPMVIEQKLEKGNLAVLPAPQVLPENKE